MHNADEAQRSGPSFGPEMTIGSASSVNFMNPGAIVDADLAWLPECAAWSDLLESAREQEPDVAYRTFQRLANCRMDFVRAGRLDRAIQRYRAQHGEPQGLPTLRLGLLGSSTLSHLHAGVRLGALRRGLLVEIYEGPYGQYRQELSDRSSDLYAFQPQALCFALDAQHLAGFEQANAPDALAMMAQCWRTAQAELGCVVLQQTVLPRLPRLMGNGEERLPSSPARVVEEINSGLRQQAPAGGVHLLAVDVWAAQDGLTYWHDPMLWFSSKHEVHPRASVMYGDQMGRMLAAVRGRSAKCLVLDLDNTLWGGVIGDDGLDGIVLGQGSAAAEAHLALQRYALQLSRRGVILAVCSKNEEANALAAFEEHPEMVLRRRDIACFVANWQDKATNLREIATELNIGLESLVFVDDNPAERALIRRELPMVAVPELPEDAAGYVDCLARAGYFESLAVTDDDRQRAEQYRANTERQSMLQSATDMDSFLDGLKMELTWSPFQRGDLARVVQLINKTNQFNLTTRRYTEGEVNAFMLDESVGTLQMRLADVYGDNGLIALVIARRSSESVLELDTWLMSCRVLGRQVEVATLNLVASLAREMGCHAVRGEYRPTEKNGMVRDHYRRLGFELKEIGSDSSTEWLLPLDVFKEQPTHMRVVEGAACHSLSFISS